jgi:hypothetical protein
LVATGFSRWNTVIVGTLDGFSRLLGFGFSQSLSGTTGPIIFRDFPANQG